jgi:hypothetical protein
MLAHVPVAASEPAAAAAPAAASGSFQGMALDDSLVYHSSPASWKKMAAFRIDSPPHFSYMFSQSLEPFLRGWEEAAFWGDGYASSGIVAWKLGLILRSVDCRYPSGGQLQKQPLPDVLHMKEQPEDAIYLDIGCNMGYMSLPVVAVGRKAICIEPVKANCDCISQVSFRQATSPNRRVELVLCCPVAAAEPRVRAKLHLASCCRWIQGRHQ